MNTNKMTEKDRAFIFETLYSELNNIKESLSDEEFKTASDKIMKNWGGPLKKEKGAMLSSNDMFDIVDAGAVAQSDIENEFGEDEFMPMDNDEYRNMMSDFEDIDENTDRGGLFKAQDANGNEINRHALVVPVDGVNKKGRVMGFGDDGSGRMDLIVSWEWPIDMKYTNPEEMGKQRVYPEDVVLANSKVENIPSESPIEEMRGLSKSVKNSGDRNVKMRDDHHEAPLTNLDESINNLFKNKVTKRQLNEFINEQARKISKNI